MYFMYVHVSNREKTPYSTKSVYLVDYLYKCTNNNIPSTSKNHCLVKHIEFLVFTYSLSYVFLVS